MVKMGEGIYRDKVMIPLHRLRGGLAVNPCQVAWRLACRRCLATGAAGHTAASGDSLPLVAVRSPYINSRPPRACTATTYWQRRQARDDTAAADTTPAAAAEGLWAEMTQGIRILVPVE